MNLQDKIDELKAEISKLEELAKEQSKPTKWEPEGGEYFINTAGDCRRCASDEDSKNFGTERKTKEAAEKASAKMRVFNRLLAYVDELAPDYEPDWRFIDDRNCYIYYSHQGGKFQYSRDYLSECLGTVYMPKHVAIALVDKLNSGEVVL